ncbi:unnamed protein product [Rotaria sordida]|uniref:Uncharacterized protein n=1 Tax=Rotaria sordida TaxID=392033 RepID=A0A814AZF6_9BILA|nr:unnamed protein product [Rotaria sordida]CAF0996618.1 unnamed protein product [Rotaria sordida]CAF4091066.1 unnamed protein product [Rotaria sordida]
MSAYYLQTFLSRFPISQYIDMNQKAQHCFLLDGKTILPINYNYQLFIPLKILNTTENKYCSCCQKKYQSHLFDHYRQQSLDENIKTTNIAERYQETLCSRSLQSITKLSEKKCFNKKISSSKIAIVKPNECKYYQSVQQINNNKNNIETCMLNKLINNSYLKNYSLHFTDLITPHMKPSMDSNQINNNQSRKSPSAITIIIKPFISSEYSNRYYEKEISLNKKLSSNKRKYSSSSSLKSITKRISTSLSDKTLNKTYHKHRLSTFKDITRPILSNSTEINHNENKSSNILHSRTLLNIYRNKKQYMKEK